jgi:hypothetical protein
MVAEFLQKITLQRVKNYTLFGNEIIQAALSLPSAADVFLVFRHGCNGDVITGLKFKEKNLKGPIPS